MSSRPSSNASAVTSLLDHLIQAAVPMPRLGEVERSRADLFAYIVRNPPPQLHPALVADDRDAEQWAAYLGELHRLVAAHTTAMLRDLKSQLVNDFDIRDIVGAMNEFRDELVGCVERAADGER